MKDLEKNVEDRLVAGLNASSPFQMHAALGQAKLWMNIDHHAKWLQVADILEGRQVIVGKKRDGNSFELSKDTVGAMCVFFKKFGEFESRVKDIQPETSVGNGWASEKLRNAALEQVLFLALDCG